MVRKFASPGCEPPCQWNQAPVTLIYQWKNKREGWRYMNDPMAKQREWSPGNAELKAHRANASKADRAWATALTADWQHATALLIVNCVKFRFIHAILTSQLFSSVSPNAIFPANLDHKRRFTRHIVGYGKCNDHKRRVRGSREILTSGSEVVKTL